MAAADRATPPDAGKMGEAKRSKAGHEFETQAAEAAAARAEEWDLPTQWGAPVRCVFLGPAAAGDAAGAAGGGSIDERPPVGWREKVRFRWEISVPDAPPGFAQEEVVAVHADKVFKRGIPVPAAWDPVLKFRARVPRAVEKARQDSPGYECTIEGVLRSPLVAPAPRPPAPRTGAKWIAREPGGLRVEVWVAAHHAAEEWWCVKATAGIASWQAIVPSTWQLVRTVCFCRVAASPCGQGSGVGSLPPARAGRCVARREHAWRSAEFAVAKRYFYSVPHKRRRCGGR